MAALPYIAESTRVTANGLGPLNNNFARAKEFNKVVERLNSISTANGEISVSIAFAAGKTIIFEGTTADAYEVTLDPGDPTADRTITLPDLTGTVVVTEGTQTINGVKTFGDTTASTSTTSGAVIVSGGVGIAKELFVSTTTPASISATGVLSVTNATDASNSTTGSVKLTGGLGVAKAVYVGTSVNAATYLTSGDGTVALPAIGPVSDPDSGLYSVGPNRLGLAVNAAKRLEVNVSGVGVVGYLVAGQIAPTNSNIDPATKSVMATSMLNGILTATPAGAISYTLPTGTEMETAAGTTVATEQGIDFSLINIGAGGTITVTAAANFSIVGLATVAVNTSAQFRLRKIATNDFILYRMT